MRRAAKKDANHNAIAQVFIDEGCSVFDASGVGQNFPDLVIAKQGDTVLVEVKGKHGQLTEGQREFADKWQGRAYTVRTEIEARAVARMVGIRQEDWK